jgi:hypothetical protein
MPIIWDINLNAEILISNSTLFNLDFETGVLIVQTTNLLDVGIHLFKFGVKLSDYPAAAYFPPESEFYVNVSHTSLLYPNFETNYTYTIGSIMSPILYKASKATGICLITVNGEVD